VINDLQEQIGKTDTTTIQADFKQVGIALVRLGEERQRILYRIRKGLVTDEEGDAQLIATGQERDMLEARKASLAAQLQGQEGRRAQLASAEALLTDLKEKAESADNHTKRQVIETLVASAVVSVGSSGGMTLAPKYRFEDPDKIAHITSTPRMGL
jgi:uncharacterized protein involved in exopolysaccharide biosynthesis